MSDLLSSTPSDALRSRLDDPQVAAALGLILDNADTLALGLVALDGLLRRADTISGNIESSLKDVKVVADSFSYLAAPTKRLTQEAPQIADAAEALLESGMLSREVVNLLGRLAQALVEGAGQGAALPACAVRPARSRPSRHGRGIDRRGRHLERPPP